MEDDIQEAIAKAERLLRVAEWAVEQELYDGAALCCYAALFWATIAALAHQGIRGKEWSHGGLRKVFRDELVRKRKLYPPVFVDWLERAYELRSEAHYKLVDLGIKVVRRIVQHAREFVVKVSEVTLG